MKSLVGLGDGLVLGHLRVFLVDAKIGETAVVEIRVIAVGVGVVFDEGVGRDGRLGALEQLTPRRGAERPQVLDPVLDLVHGCAGLLRDPRQAVVQQVVEMVLHDLARQQPLVGGFRLGFLGVDLQEQALAAVAGARSPAARA